MKRLWISFVFFIFLLNHASSAPIDGNYSSKFIAKVQLRITGPENITGEARSYLGRELRSLGDILLADDVADWTLDIIVLELKTVAGYKNGIAISVVVMQAFHNASLTLWQKMDLGKFVALQKIASDTLAFTEHLVFVDHLMYVSGSNELKNTCQKIIADFDSVYLEGDRMQHKQLEELRKK